MFRLLRYFSVASLLSIALAALLLGALYRQVALGNLLSMGEHHNLELAYSLSNAMRAETDALLQPDEPDADPALRDARLESYSRSVLKLTRELSVVKVKIYDLNGRTVFSSEARQIGEDRSGNQGFRQALRGQTASELTHRDQFSAFDRTIVNRDLLASYVPIWHEDRREVQAVFEIYEDITPLLAELSRTQRHIMSGVVLVLLGLYAILFMIVRHADRILRRQHVEGMAQTQQLETARDTLEQRVLERTQALEGVNDSLKAEISERERTQARLIEARLAAEEASKAKSQFLANMSHEIRTPMNGVLGMTELLLDAGLDDTQRHYAQTIRSSAESLLRIINDILDFSKIEAGRLELDPSEVGLGALCAEALQLMGPSAGQKQLALDCTIADGVPASVRADRVRLMQVLLNLLGNAIKFTPAGSVKLGIARVDEPATSGDDCLIRFSVTDSGIGISDEAQARLFRAFSQADGSTTRRFGGTGLGLAVSKQLCEMMGGDIGLRSESGKGSTFWFTIRAPILDATQASTVRADPLPVIPDRAAETLPPVSRSGPRVLLAEDSAVNAEIARAVLKAAGCRVTAVANGRLAVEAWRSQPFDVVLMDCQMPELDGFGATREIRALEAGASVRVPIIALTANAMEGDRERCLAAGMDDYLSKPFKRAQLHAVIARWVPAGGSVSGLASPSAGDAGPSGADPGTWRTGQSGLPSRSIATSGDSVPASVACR
ncbi:MAG: response regulator [Burkholderiales bacterium]|nr:response regulator [Burkholderiales bacterium]